MSRGCRGRDEKKIWNHNNKNAGFRLEGRGGAGGGGGGEEGVGRRRRRWYYWKRWREAKEGWEIMENTREKRQIENQGEQNKGGPITFANSTPVLACDSSSREVFRLITWNWGRIKHLRVVLRQTKMKLDPGFFFTSERRRAARQRGKERRREFCN